MSVLIQTNKGELIVDLFVDECPVTCQNFLSLCHVQYYENCLFFNIEQNMLIQSGDPTNTGRGGQSIFGILKQQKQISRQNGPLRQKFRGFFANEIRTEWKHNRRGLLCMANAAPDHNTSQFYITTTHRHLDSLDEKHTIFGEVAEGMETVMAINDVVCDNEGRPYQAIRIKDTVVLVDPFQEEGKQLDGLEELMHDGSKPWKHADEHSGGGGGGGNALVAEAEENGENGSGMRPDLLLLDEEEERQLEEQRMKNKEEQEEALQVDEARSRAVVLTAIGDLPEEDVKPPENVLFVCKLNPVTRDDDLKVLFSQFGRVVSCEIIKDKFTGDSLCFGFVEFDTKEACEDAYFKMDNVVVDDRRIHVDFSQSVSRLWNKNQNMGKNATYSRDERSEWKNHSRRDSSHGRGGRQREKKERPSRLPQQYGDKSFDIVLDQDNGSSRSRHSEPHDNGRRRRKHVIDRDSRDIDRRRSKKRGRKRSYSSDSYDRLSSDDERDRRRERRKERSSSRWP